MAGLRYLGRGEFIPGVPARDLTAEEAAQFRAVIREHRENTGRELYGPPIPVTAVEHGDAEPSGDAEHGDAEAPASPALAKRPARRGTGAEAGNG